MTNQTAIKLWSDIDDNQAENLNGGKSGKSYSPPQRTYNPVLNSTTSTIYSIETLDPATGAVTGASTITVGPNQRIAATDTTTTLYKNGYQTTRTSSRYFR